VIVLKGCSLTPECPSTPWPATKDSRDEQQGFNAFRVQKKLGATTNPLEVTSTCQATVGGHVGPIDAQ
jgi:hypothetical protein